MWTQTRRNTIILILVSDSNVLDVLRNISYLSRLSSLALLKMTMPMVLQWTPQTTSTLRETLMEDSTGIPTQD